MGLLNCILFNSIQLLLFLPLFLSLPIHTMLYPDFFFGTFLSSPFDSRPFPTYTCHSSIGIWNPSSSVSLSTSPSTTFSIQVFYFPTKQSSKDILQPWLHWWAIYSPSMTNIPNKTKQQKPLSNFGSNAAKTDGEVKVCHWKTLWPLIHTHTRKRISTATLRCSPTSKLPGFSSEFPTC